MAILSKEYSQQFNNLNLSILNAIKQPSFLEGL